MFLTQQEWPLFMPTSQNLSNNFALMMWISTEIGTNNIIYHYLQKKSPKSKHNMHRYGSHWLMLVSMCIVLTEELRFCNIAPCNNVQEISFESIINEIQRFTVKSLTSTYFSKVQIIRLIKSSNAPATACMPIVYADATEAI